MHKIKNLLFLTTVALLLNSCSTTIHDFTSCGLIPGDIGADCDNFLTSDPEVYDESEWELLELSWEQSGNAVECMPSSALSQLKASLEKLCSVGKCTYQEKAAVHKFFARIKDHESRIKLP
jgi:hypothetical protein